MTFRLALTLLVPGLLLTACNREPASGEATPIAVTTDAIDDTATAVVAATEHVDTLQPNESLQGTIDVDFGEGPVSMRSIATKMADDLGERTAERLGSAEGQRQLDRARSDVGERLGADQAASVSAADVQAIADHYAGKTVYSSDVRAIDILKAFQVTLDARDNEGRRVTISIRLNQNDLSMVDSKIEYQPDAKRLTASFESGDDDAAPVVTLTRIERTADDRFAIAGHIEAAGLEPGVLAKSLRGQRIERIRAEFRFDNLPLKSSGI